MSNNVTMSRRGKSSSLLLFSSFLLSFLLSFPIGQAQNAVQLGVPGAPAPQPAVSVVRSSPFRPRPGGVSDRVAMVAPVVQRFKEKLAYGPPEVLKTWVGDDVCSYKGFSCDNIPDLNQQKAVSGVDFNKFGLAGKGGKLELGGFLDELPDLTFFHASSNNFSGAVPDIDVAKLRFFFEFDISNNKFVGTFPPQVLRATKLAFLDIRFNSFYGTIPPELFTMDIYTMILVNHNNFSGEIPSTLGKTTALALNFVGNSFTGSIPSSIGDAAETLNEVLFFNNKMSGCLPPEIGKLKKATFIDANNNFLHGPIPESFSCLESIKLLNFGRNRLSGAIPESLCQLGITGNLQNLTFAENYITQVGPVCRKLIEQKYLDVDMNCVPNFRNQRSKAECDKFFSQKLTCPSVNSNQITCQNNKTKAGDDKSKVLRSSTDAAGHRNRGGPPQSLLSSSTAYATLEP